MPTINLGKLRFIFRGDYDGATTYDALDVVRHNSNVYACLVDATVGVEPPTSGDSTEWSLMVEGAGVVTTQGDMLYHDGTSVARLPKGLSGEVLSSDADGNPAWTTPQGRPGTTVKALMGSGPRSYSRATLMTDGTVMLCGYSNNYSMSSVTNNHSYAPRPLCVSGSPAPKTPFKKVRMAGRSGFALSEDGEVWSWGYNGYGQLGHGDTVNRAAAERIEYFATNNITIVDIAVPDNFYWDYGWVLFVTDLGHVYACGHNSTGQCGDGTTTNKNTPGRVGTLSGITKIMCGMANQGTAIALDETTGELWGWGNNGDGQLGLGDTTTRTIAAQIMASGVIDFKIMGGSQTTVQHHWLVVLNSTGQLLTCGFNDYGQLGNGNTTAQSSLGVVASDVTHWNAGDGHYGFMICRDNTGQWRGTGYNGYGQLGLGDNTDRAGFVPIAGLSGFTPKDLSSFYLDGDMSYGSSFIVRDDDTLWCCGNNTHGRLGLGHTTAANPTWQQLGTITPDMKVIDMEIGGHYSSPMTRLLLSDGRVLAAGYNGHGSLGVQPDLYSIDGFQPVRF